ncbi:MAG: alpha/beta hydrolase [Asgard group archaeon]|nr:alpha/beta hydrolase [Asgard group archaeon]
MKLASFFVKMIAKQMKKQKDYEFDFDDPEAIANFRKTLQKMFSIMRVASGVKIEHFQIGDIPADKHTLKSEVPDSMTMLHLHGGGYFSGNCEMYRPFVSSICKQLQVNAYSISYRLVPEHPYPAALDDAFYAYKWLLEEQSIPAEKIIILGDSVGGGLALALLHRISKQNLPQPKCVISISPWTDLTFTNNSYVTNREEDAFFNFTNLENAAKKYIGNDSAKNPEISPIFADFDGFPPIFLQVGSTEMLLDDSVVIAEKMRKQGVSVTIDVWENLFHDFPIFSRMPLIGRLAPEFKQAMKNVKIFVDNL